MAKDIKAFMAWVRQHDRKRALVLDAKSGPVGDALYVTMAQGFHLQPYQLRLQTAQALWRVWADQHAKGDLDGVTMRFVDQMGNIVGGTSIWSGAWVQKE